VHYALTLRDWCRNLDAGWDEAVAEVGEPRARVWKLYMAASRAGFELDRLELHQVLGVRLTSNGSAGMPLRPDWERAGTAGQIGSAVAETGPLA
jgi:cyclopropane-fatty-acyl-phospholipid synthase